MKGKVLVVLSALLVLFAWFGCKKTNVVTPAEPTATVIVGTSTISPTFTVSPTITQTFTITQTSTITPTFTATYRPQGWIDDCEDGASPDTGNVCDYNGDAPAPNVGGYWITFDDDDWSVPYPSAGTPGSTVPAGKSNCGTSYVWPMSAGWSIRTGETAEKFSMSQPGYPSSPYGGAYCARMTGYVTTNIITTKPGAGSAHPETQTGFQYGFIGMGVQLQSTAGSPTCTKVDISGFTGVQFWARSTSNSGTGADFRLKLPYVPNTDCDNPITGTLDKFDDYACKVTVTSTWTLYQKPFSGFAQAGWGTAVPKLTVLQHASQIQFQTFDQPAYFLFPNSVDLEVDDIQLYH